MTQIKEAHLAKEDAEITLHSRDFKLQKGCWKHTPQQNLRHKMCFKMKIFERKYYLLGNSAEKATLVKRLAKQSM